MAIQGSFNLNNALKSQAYAYKCWYNYNYGNNTLGISPQDMGEITQTWESELKNWHATAMDDENAYEIEDDDFSTAKMNGENQAKEKTGYDGKQGGQITRTVVDSVASVGGAVISSGVANSIGKYAIGNIGSKLVEKSVEKAAEKASTTVANKISEKGMGSSGSWIIGAPLALATGTAYTAKKPNKDEKEACDALQDEMVNSENALYVAQDDMSVAGEEIIALSDEVQTYNEDGNETIKENKAEYDMYKASYDALMQKVESGATLTDSEKALLKELVPLMQELGVGIQTAQEEVTEVAEDIYDEMGTYQTDYDNAASTVAEVQGVTDYAESFDESTQTMCYVEAGAQTINAASGATAAYRAGTFAASGGIFTAWAWGFAAMGTAGAAMSMNGTFQQYSWADEVGKEIDMRKTTQDVNSQTNDIYDESIADYEGAMVGVEEMELEMPEDMENPEEVVAQLGEEAAETLTTLGGQAGEETDAGSGLAAGISTESPSSAAGTGTTQTRATFGKDPEDKEKTK